jgi:hypothetical protein
MSVGIVMPIRDLERDFDMVSANLRNCIEHDVRAWLILDSSQVRQYEKWEILRNTFKSDYFSYTHGNYNSPGLARNSVLSDLDVDWIGFCDSDDLMDMKELTRVSTFGNQRELDVVVANLEVRDRYTNLSIKKHGISSNIPVPLSLCIFPAFTRIVYRVNFIKNLSFPEFKLGEDQCFLFEVLCNSPKIEYLDARIYVYFRNVAGQLTSRNENYSDLLKAIKLIDILNRRYGLKNDLEASIIKMRLSLTFSRMCLLGSRKNILELYQLTPSLFRRPLKNLRAAGLILVNRRKLD